MKLKNLFLKIKNFIVNVFTTVDKTAKKIIPIGISVVNAIKNFAESDAADWVTAIIPGDLDNRIQALLIKITPGILLGLRKWQSITGEEDVNTKLKLIFNEIKSLDKVDRDGVKTEIASRINAAILGHMYGTEEVLPAYDVKIMTLAAYHHPDVLEDEKAA